MRFEFVPAGILGEGDGSRLVFDYNLQPSRWSIGRHRQWAAVEPSFPLCSIENKPWSVDRRSAPSCGIGPLSRSVFFPGEPILPTQPIPIVHMKSHRNNLFPKPSLVLKLAQPGFGWGTAAASFGSINFQQGDPLRPALKCRFSMRGD